MADDPKQPAPDFDDDLSDLIGGEMRERPLPLPRSFVPALERPEFSEGCPACHGTGFWHGRRNMPCFKCKGKGKRTFRTSPEARAKARAKGAEKAAQRDADKALWREQHKAEIAWATAAAARNAQRSGTFDFPAKLLEALTQYGSWTDGQLAAVQKLMARDAARKVESTAKRTSAVDAGKIEAAFAHARERAARPGMAGIWTKPLKLRAADTDLTFQPGSAGSQWEGMIFVRAGEKKLGSIAWQATWDGKAKSVFTRRFECTDAEAAAVTQACSDPATAAVAFGKAWGVCSVCDRTLTNDESIARGIGPICAERFGW
jgi:hypothetical protein